jgi:hypothetical protein
MARGCSLVTASRWLHPLQLLNPCLLKFGTASYARLGALGENLGSLFRLSQIRFGGTVGSEAWARAATGQANSAVLPLEATYMETCK